MVEYLEVNILDLGLSFIQTVTTLIMNHARSIHKKNAQTLEEESKENKEPTSDNESENSETKVRDSFGRLLFEMQF